MRLEAIAKLKVISMTVLMLLGAGVVHGRSTTSQLQVAATILGKGNCSFVTPGPYLINFSPLNPFLATDQTANVTFSVNCTGLGNGTSVVVVDRVGANQLYLTKGTDTIPYYLNLPTSEPVKNNTPVSVTLTATILGNTYKNAPAGNYSDTITINVAP